MNVKLIIQLSGKFLEHEIWLQKYIRNSEKSKNSFDMKARRNFHFRYLILSFEFLF